MSPSADPVFEGQSSFQSETRLARDAAYSAVATLSGNGLDQNVSTALLSLKDSLDRQGQHSTTPQGPNLSDINLLPVSFVVALVKRIKAKPPFFLVYHRLHEHVRIEALCQKIYFPSEPIPAGSTTLLYGLLYYVIRDYMHEEDSELSGFDCASYAEICLCQFNQDLKNLEMIVNPTLEKVQAMLVAVSRFNPSSRQAQLLIKELGHKSAGGIQSATMLDVPFCGVQYVPDNGLPSQFRSEERQTRSRRSETTCILESLHD